MSDKEIIKEVWGDTGSFSFIEDRVWLFDVEKALKKAREDERSKSKWRRLTRWFKKLIKGEDLFNLKPEVILIFSLILPTGLLILGIYGTHYHIVHNISMK